MLEWLPQEAEAIRRFFRVLGCLGSASRVVYHKGLYIRPWGAMAAALALSGEISLGCKLKLWRFHDRSLQDLFDDCQLSPLAQRILFGNAGLFADDAALVSAGVYAAATTAYHLGPTYPVEGFSSIIAALVDVIQESGGAIETGARVTAIGVDGATATSVVVESGAEYPCDVLISTAAPRILAQSLPQTAPDDLRYEPSNSLTGLYLNMRPSVIQPLCRSRNIWWYAGTGKLDFAAPDMRAKPQMLYLSTGCLTQDERAASVVPVTVFAPANFDQAQAAHARGGRAYQSFLVASREAILETVDAVLYPGFSTGITDFVIKGPWEVMAEVGAERGNVYGRRPTPKGVLAAVGSHHEVRNLHFACASIGQAGVATAFQTATLVAGAALAHSE